MDLSNGQHYTTADFNKLATTDEARSTYAGWKTLQRAAIGHTFMGTTSEGKQRLVQQLGSLRFQHLQVTDPELVGTFYSRSNPQQNLNPNWDNPELLKLR